MATAITLENQRRSIIGLLPKINSQELLDQVIQLLSIYEVKSGPATKARTVRLSKEVLAHKGVVHIDKDFDIVRSEYYEEKMK